MLFYDRAHPSTSPKKTARNQVLVNRKYSHRNTKSKLEISKIKYRVVMFVLFLVQIVFYFSAVGAATIDSGKDFCANPVASENPVDLKWLHEHFEEGWNIQFGHPEERKQFAQFVNGLGNTEEEDDYSQMCARMKLDYVEEHFTGQFNGYGGKVSPFSCTPAFLCNITSSDKTAEVQVQTHVSYFDRTTDDKHNMAAVIQCPPNGEALYKVITISKTISEEEIKTITEHLRSIGIDPDNRVSFRSENCP